MSRNGSPAPYDDVRRAPRRRRDRLFAWAFSAGAHLIIFTALFWPRAAHPPPPAEPSPILVSLIELPKPEPPGLPDATKAKAGAPETAVHPTPPRAAAPVAASAAIPAPDTSDLLSESQMAEAARVGEEGSDGDGEGGGGGGCNTARFVQQALQRDPLVRTAVEGANRQGKSVMLWNGDWVRSGDQEGKGLSAVREAIIWELAFAPEACRNERMHGMVLLSLADGNTRFAIGSGEWRWSDLLGLRVPRSER